ncbi:MAG: PAS domain S-box protein, partial [Nitrospinae bacterium]|nr:PAS domain S-box protein [Nitrospinota bacterium]
MKATTHLKDAGIGPSKLLEKTLASLDEAILVVNPDTRAIVSCNRAAEDIFGYPREEIIGRNTEFLHVDRAHYEAFGKALFPALNATGVFHKEFMMRRRDGSLFPTDMTVTEIRDDEGARVGVVSAVRDITLRVAAEREASLQRDNFMRILNAVTDGIYIVNSAFDIEYVNPVIEREFGKADGRKCYAYFHNRKEQCPWCKNEKVFKGESVRWEWSSSKTGKTYDLLDTPIINPDGSMSKFEIFHDITERKLMENALRESEERYRSLFENSHAVLLVINPADGAIVDANPAAVAYYGWTREELQRKKIMDINTLTPDQVRAEMDMARVEKRNHFIFRHRRAHGEPHDVEVYSGPIRAHGKDLLYSIIFDITERKRAEDVIRLHSDILKNLSEGVFLIRASDGVIVFANERFSAMFGYDPGELAGKHVSALNAPTTKSPEDIAKEIVGELLRSGVWSGEVQNIRKDATTFWCHASVRTFEHPQFGQVWVSVHEDITARKQAEEALRQRTVELAERVKELNCLYGISKIIAEPGKSAYEILEESVHLIPPALFYPEISCARIVLDGSEFKTENFRETPWKLSSGIVISGEVVGRVDVCYLEGKSPFDEGPFTKEERSLVDYLSRKFAVMIERKRAQEALRQREELLRNYFDLGQVGMAITSIGQKWVRVNDRLCEILGYTKDELTSMTWTELTYPDDLEPDLAQFRRLLAGEIERYAMDKRFVHKNGNIVQTRLTVACQRKPDRSVEYVIASVEDITERKNAEEALRQSEADLQEAQRIAHVGSWRLISASNSVTWTEELYRMLGLDPSQPPPNYTEHMRLFTPESWERLSAALALTQEKGIPYKLELEMVRPGKNNGWMLAIGEPQRDASGAIIGLQGVAQDITERKLAEETLRLKTAELDIFFSTALDLLCIANTDGYFIRLNPEWEKTLGYTLKDLQGKRFLDFVHPDDLESTLKVISALSDQKDVLNFTNRYRHRDGTYRWIEWHSKPVGSLIYAAARDITERKKAEEQLRLASIYTRTLLETSLDPLVTISSGGKITDVNSAAENVTGLPRDRIIGTDFSSYFTEPEKADIVYRRVFEEGYVTDYPLAIRHSSGKITDVLYNASVYGNEQGEVAGVFAAARDITERKRAESELREKTALLENVINSSTDYIFVKDRNLRTILCNTVFARAQGKTPAELYGKTDIENGWDPDLVLGSPEKGIRGFQQDDLAALSGEIVRSSSDLGNVGGETRAFDSIKVPLHAADGEIIGLIGVSRDITERKQAEMALAQSELNYRTVADFTNDWETWRDPEGRFRYVSPSCERITGYPKERFISDPDFLPSIIHRQDVGAYNEHLATSHKLGNAGSRQGSEPERVMFRIARSDGAIRWIEHVCQRVFDQNGRWLGNRGSNRDITDLVSAREQAEAATKLKDKFVSLVAHDLRSPFTSMMGLLHLFTERKSLLANDDDKKIVDTVFKSGERMLGMIDQLLKISRLQTGQITPQPRFFNGHTSVAFTINAIGHNAAQKGIEIINDVPVDMRLYADTALFDEVLLNLMTNAIKFCSRGDKIAVFTPPGLKSAIAVRDTG